MPPIAPSRDMTSARAIGQYVRPSTASSSVHTQSHQPHGSFRDFSRHAFALEKFRRLRQLQEAAALSPQGFHNAHRQGNFRVLEIYYPKAVHELWSEATERLAHQEGENKAGAEQPQISNRQRSRTLASTSRPGTTESKPRSLLLRTTSLSAASSPTKSPFSDTLSLSLSERSMAFGRRLRATDLPPQSPPPNRPLPAPPLSPRSLVAATERCSIHEQSALPTDTYVQSLARSISTRSQQTCRTPGHGLALLDRTPSPRSTRFPDRTPLPDDGWLHPCERDINIDDETYLGIRESARRKGEEEGWKGMASKAVTLVKGKNKGRVDPIPSAATPTGSQRWEQGSYY